MRKSPTAHSWVELDRRALQANARFLINRAKPAKLMPVIKGNAYGHGMIPVAKLLAPFPLWGFGVAGLQEALQLRARGIRKPIAVLSYLEPESALKEAIEKDISLVVYDKHSVERIHQASSRSKKRARVHVKIDTGTTRIGFRYPEALDALRMVARDARLTIEGIFSHLADAESTNQHYTDLQVKRFQKIRTEFPQKAAWHIACSAALLRKPQDAYQIARAGLALYGLWPSEATKRSVGKPHALQPVLSWKTRIIQLKSIPQGTPVSYERTYVTKRPTTLAILPVGYADGYDRSLSNRGTVLIHGRRAPIRGRVCMNLLMVDVTQHKNVRIGDTVTLIGTEGRGVVYADTLAHLANTISYEVLTRISPSLPRIVL